MKKSFDYGLALAVVLVFALIASIATVVNVMVLGLLAHIPFFEIHAVSAEAFWLFAFGMVFASIPTSSLRFASLLLLAFALPIGLFTKVHKLADQIAGFFFLLGYQYFLDDAMGGISLSLYAHLALTFIYLMVFDFFMSDEAKERVRKWRKKRKEKRRKRQGKRVA